MYIGPYVKYWLFLLDFNNCWNFLEYLGKTLKTNLMQTFPVAVELFYVDRQNDGRTDRHKDANCPFSHCFERA